MTRRATSPLAVPACALALALASGGCASGPASALACARGQQAMVSERLYFGTAMPQGGVTIEDWRGFVDTVVTPRFPDGLTAWPATGQWRSASGAPVREASHVLDIVHARDARSDAAIAEVVDAYKRRFDQESVLRVTSAVCASF